MSNIIRNPTSEEKADFQPLVTAKGTHRTVKDRFVGELHKEKAKALVENKPFADAVCLEEWENAHKKQLEDLYKKFGFIPEKEFKPIKPNFTRFHDINNYELLDEFETRDGYESKRQNKEIFVKYKKYNFKGTRGSIVVRVKDEPKVVKDEPKVVKDE